MSSSDEPSSLTASASAIVAQAVGWHILRIDGYSNTKGLGFGKFITSEPFVVGGHRWRLKYYPDGNGESHSDWISIYLGLDQTNTVDEVKAKFIISLLDQEGNPAFGRHSAMRTFSVNGSEWGFKELIRRCDLEASVYLKDDVFSVRCHVTVANEIFTKTIPVSELRRGIVKQETAPLSRGA